MDPTQIVLQIVMARKKMNYTQKELADRLNLSDKTISKWERGVGCPDISLLLPLCEELKIDVSQLLGKKPTDKIDTKEEQKFKQLAEYAKLKVFEDKVKVLKIICIVLVALSFLSIGICLLAEYIMNKHFTWSFIASASIIYGCSIIVTFLMSKTFRIEKTLLLSSFFLFPFLYVIDFQMRLESFYPLAYIFALGGIVLVWLIYVVLFHLRINIWFQLALIIVLSLAYNLFVHLSLSEDFVVLYVNVFAYACAIFASLIRGVLSYKKNRSIRKNV